jgi:hypothetical protein
MKYIVEEVMGLDTNRKERGGMNQSDSEKKIRISINSLHASKEIGEQRGVVKPEHCHDLCSFSEPTKA